MSLCPVCGRLLCDCTLEERGQTELEFFRPLTKEEKRAYYKTPADYALMIKVAQKHAHDPVKGNSQSPLKIFRDEAKRLKALNQNKKI